jgi:hypothetical protein
VERRPQRKVDDPGLQGGTSGTEGPFDQFEASLPVDGDDRRTAGPVFWRDDERRGKKTLEFEGYPGGG